MGNFAMTYLVNIDSTYKSRHEDKWKISKSPPVPFNFIMSSIQPFLGQILGLCGLLVSNLEFQPSNDYLSSCNMPSPLPFFNCYPSHNVTHFCLVSNPDVSFLIISCNI